MNCLNSLFYFIFFNSEKQVTILGYVVVIGLFLSLVLALWTFLGSTNLALFAHPCH